MIMLLQRNIPINIFLHILNIESSEQVTLCIFHSIKLMFLLDI